MRDHPHLQAVEDAAARVAKGAVTGFLGGVIASWVMNQYQTIEARPVNVRRRERELTSAGWQPAPESKSADGADPKVKVAEIVSRRLFDHPLSQTEQSVAAPVVHYGYGGAVGALYGGLSEVLPTVKIGLGIPYASLLWLGGAEIALPALGLAKSPTTVSTDKHASALATHFVYGITLDIARRVINRLI
jgi:hypothetical protein